MTRNIVQSVIAAAVLLSACSSKVSGLKTAPIDPNANSGNLTLKWVGNTSLITIGIDKNAIGKVQLLAGTDPVAGATISFATDGTTGGAYLQANTDTTDGDGYASVNILAKDAASFRIGATTEGLAAPSYINVDVNGKYLGDVVVRANNYNGPAKPTFYFVRLHNSNTQGGGCATFRPDQIPPSIAEQQVANIQLDTVFSNQQDKLSVYATIVGMSGTRAVVYGCGGPATVLGQQRVTINVDLNTADADIRGDYTFGQEIQPLAFLNQGSLVAIVLHDITAPFIDLGSFLSSGIWTLDANPTIGNGEGLGICSLLGSNSAFGTFCQQTGPAAIDAGLQALLGLDPTATEIYNDLHSGTLLLTDLKVGGVMNIKDYDKGTGALDGTFVYDSYRFLWTDKCTAASPVCCGHTIYDGAKLGIQPFQANFTGTATPLTGSQIGYNFSTDSAELGLAYGRLALAILEDAILPAISGSDAWDTNGPNLTCASPPAPHTACGDGKIQFGEIIAAIFSCGPGPVPPGAPSVCTTAAWAVGGIVDNLIGQLQFNGTSDWNIHEQVNAGQLLDTDDDLQADTLTGSLQMTADAAGNPTTANQLFVARYKGTVCTGDGTCGNGYACHFAVNAVDGCFADNACGAAIGQYLGDTACLNDTDCKSGLCPRPTGVANAVQPHAGFCFEACASDADCLGNGHCDLNGYVTVATNGATNTYLGPDDVETITGMCVR